MSFCRMFLAPTSYFLQDSSRYDPTSHKECIAAGAPHHALPSHRPLARGREGPVRVGPGQSCVASLRRGGESFWPSWSTLLAAVTFRAPSSASKGLHPLP